MPFNQGKDGVIRAYGAETIKRVIERQKPDYAAKGATSIADKTHAGSREQQRRLRQQERRSK